MRHHLPPTRPAHGAEISLQVSNEAIAELETTFKVAATDATDVDWSLGPLVQSGGGFTTAVTNPAALSPATRFSDDVILYSAIMKYKAHHALVARTYLIDPSPSQLSVYESLLDAQAHLIDRLRPGAVVGEVVGAVIERIMARPGMPPEAKLSRTFGSAIGARVGDKYCVLNSKNTAVIAPGMVFGVSMALTDIPLSDVPPTAAKTMGKLTSYSLLLADTVVVGSDGAPTVVTDKASKERSQVVYSLAGEEEEDEGEEEDGGGDKDAKAASKKQRRAAEAAAAAAAAAGRVGGRSSRLQARAGDSAENEAARKKREEHQAALMAQRRAAAIKKGTGGAGAGDDEEGGPGDELANAPPIAAFSSSSEYPKGTRANAIIVDKAHNAVLVPLFGTLVPFHVSTIKSVVKSEEGLKAFLRLNFYSANQALGKDVAPAMAAAVQRHGESIFIRTLNFASRDHRNLTAVEAQIKVMQKNARAARETAKQQATLVEQPKIILSKDKVPRLSDLSMWPAVSGRKTVGTMEAHVNGLRYTSNKGERVEVAYANIRHAIFQPCESEHTVLLHFHLRHAIILGKKKLKDVQFFTEVINASQALDGRGRSDYDVDEYGEEERERCVRVCLGARARVCAHADARRFYPRPPPSHSPAPTPALMQQAARRAEPRLQALHRAHGGDRGGGPHGRLPRRLPHVRRAHARPGLQRRAAQGDGAHLAVRRVPRLRCRQAGACPVQPPGAGRSLLVCGARGRAWDSRQVCCAFPAPRPHHRPAFAPPSPRSRSSCPTRTWTTCTLSASPLAARTLTWSSSSRRARATRARRSGCA